MCAGQKPNKKHKDNVQVFRGPPSPPPKARRVCCANFGDTPGSGELSWTVNLEFFGRSAGKVLDVLERLGKSTSYVPYMSWTIAWRSLQVKSEICPEES